MTNVNEENRIEFAERERENGNGDGDGDGDLGSGVSGPLPLLPLKTSRRKGNFASMGFLYLGIITIIFI